MLASTAKAGFVAPARPTANAFAEPEVMVVAPVASDVNVPTEVSDELTTPEAKAVPVRAEAATLVAVIVPVPLAASDAPLPTIIAALVLVDPVIALNADDPLPPPPPLVA